MATTSNVNEIQKKTLLCYQCSKCASVCPAFRIGQFNPRSFILGTIGGGIDAAAGDKTIWGCQTCGACDVCPMSIDIPGVVLAARQVAFKKGSNLPPPAKIGHRRIFNLAQNIQARSPLPPVTNTWPRNNQKFTEKGSLALYTGTMPIWNALMYNYDINFTAGLQAILEAMNVVGVEPAIPAGFKDSGHDLYYGGDVDTFLELATANRDLVERLGIKTLVVVNPEDYHVMKNVYPKYIDGFEPELVFWTDFLMQKGFLKQLEYQAYLDVDIQVAYHDPCKLGRINKIFDSPREILANLPGVRLVPMVNEMEAAPCCGVTAFIGCDDNTLYLRHERLNEAANAGAEIMITTCPSCVSHFSCACLSVTGDDKTPKVMDLASFIGKRLFKF